MVDRSRCEARKKSRNGYGLLNIQPSLYRRPGAPRTGAHASEWTTANLMGARSNLGLGARLLRMWQEQHDALDITYGGCPPPQRGLALLLGRPGAQQRHRGSGADRAAAAGGPLPGPHRRSPGRAPWG